MRVAAIVINYRTQKLTAQVVTALLAELEPVQPSVLFLVDNDSGDGSVAYFQAASQREGWGDRVRIIAAEKNGGYGYGINLGVRAGLALPDPPDYFFVLNSDAFADPMSVRKLVDFMDNHPEAGIAGSLIHGPDQKVQASAFRFPTLLGELEATARFGLFSLMLDRYIVPLPPPTQTKPVEWISGSSMLIRRRVFENVGLFDEGFFLYFEEVDFCHSAREAGEVCYFVADAPITHIGSVSTGFEDKTRRMPDYWFKSRHRYLEKHYGFAYTLLADAAWVAGYLVWRSKEAVLRRPTGDRPHLMFDFLKHTYQWFGQRNQR